VSSIEISRVSKRFGTAEIIRNIDLAIGDGEFVVLVGPSGCGKSTLLRMIAGLEDITAGTISIGNRVVNHLPPQQRDVAMVFQSYALYPHYNVYKNMAFGLKIRSYPKDEIDAKVRHAAAILGLTDLLDRYPKNLSGGQRQRVAMGRAIVRDPLIYLFDEPLSNLDAKLRISMRTEIKALHKKLRRTTVYVTHDQVEAMTMADRIVILRDGFIEQIGTPREVYARPANAFVAGFIGAPTMNFFAGTVTSAAAGTSVVALQGGEMLTVDRLLPDGRAVTVGIRPEHLSLTEGTEKLRGLVLLIEPTGASDYLVVETASGMATVVCPSGAVEAGGAVELRALRGNLHVFDAASGRVLTGTESD
jgi:multiple sugar transport system ATP-binding protein